MSDRASSFRPFETSLDQEVALRLLRATLTGAEDGELFLERKRSEALVFDLSSIMATAASMYETPGLVATIFSTARENLFLVIILPSISTDKLIAFVPCTAS